MKRVTSLEFGSHSCAAPVQPENYAVELDGRSLPNGVIRRAWLLSTRSRRMNVPKTAICDEEKRTIQQLNCLQPRLGAFSSAR